jgi:hypothetical protein
MLDSGFMWYVPPLAAERHKTAGHDWIICKCSAMMVLLLLSIK